MNEANYRDFFVPSDNSDIFGEPIELTDLDKASLRGTIDTFRYFYRIIYQHEKVGKYLKPLTIKHFDDFEAELDRIEEMLSCTTRNGEIVEPSNLIKKTISMMRDKEKEYKRMFLDGKLDNKNIHNWN